MKELRELKDLTRHDLKDIFTRVNIGSTFASRRSALDFCLGGQRSLRAAQPSKWAALFEGVLCTIRGV